MNRVLRNWLILGGCLAVLSALSQLLENSGLGSMGGLLAGLGQVAIGLLAIVDGARRALGRRSLLGSGRGPAGRLLAGVQIVLGALLLVSLVAPLPPIP